MRLQPNQKSFRRTLEVVKAYLSRENEDAGALPNRDFWQDFNTNQPTAAGVSALSLVYVVYTERTLVYSVCIKKTCWRKHVGTST